MTLVLTNECLSAYLPTCHLISTGIYHLSPLFTTFYSFCPLFFFCRVSLDPKSQSAVGFLRTQLSQFNRVYKSGSLIDPDVPDILKKSLEL